MTPTIMKHGVIVFDHDGTLTDPEREGPEYSAHYIRILAHRLSQSEMLIRRRFADAEKKIREQPDRHFWHVNGLPVAASVSDPLLFVEAQAALVLQSLIRDGVTRTPQAPREQSELLESVYAESYERTVVKYRDGARRVLRQLRASGFQPVIMTNSGTDAVRRKLTTLFDGSARIPYGIEIRGNARKYSIDADWDGSPLYIQPDGFAYRVLLRRKRYIEALRSLGEVAVVIGDIYEMDLAVAEAAGIPTLLVTSAYTPPWVLNHYRRHHNGGAVSRLEDVPHMLETLGILKL